MRNSPVNSTQSCRGIRRNVLRGLSLVALPGVVLLASSACAAPACVLSPEITEGPFFVDEHLERSDLVGDAANSPGLRGALPLLMTIAFVDARSGCAPIPNLQVDVWHADARGNYSDVQGQRGQTFCRGYQRTDADGTVSFSTIYPGWYPGRTIHIHVKARAFDADRRPTRDYTTQLFFDEATNGQVMAMAPYSGRGRRTTSNARDGIYANASSLILATSARSDGPGLASKITLGLDNA